MRKKAEKQSMRQALASRSLRAGSYSLAVCAVALVIVVVVNLIAGTLPARVTEFDLSTNALYSLSDYSKQIVKTLDYISDHLHSRIMLEDAADHLHLSAAYLSRLFKSEVGMTFIDYVNQKKIESAANLLRYSEYSTLEISNLLAFSSQSYFIKIFKKYMGTTPGGYKAAYQLPDFQQDEAV